MFKFEEESIQTIIGLVKSYYPNSREATRETRAGLRLLEKLLNFDHNDYVGENTGYQIVKHISDPYSDITYYEKILVKLVQLLDSTREDTKHRIPNEDISGLSELYCRLGIMAELNASFSDIVKNRKYFEDGNVVTRVQLYQILPKYVYDKNLHAGYWRGRQLAYVYAWQLRNVLEDTGRSLTDEEAPRLQAAVLAALIDICNRSKIIKDKINEEKSARDRQNTPFIPLSANPIDLKFKSSLKTIIKFTEYKKAVADNLERQDFFDNNFYALPWNGTNDSPENTENNNFVWPEDTPAIMFVGEAGAGKSTQMEKLYQSELESKAPTLPIWIKVQDLTADKDSTENPLIAKIKECLDEYADYYVDCIEYGFITLYLDGLNELLVLENNSIWNQESLLCTITELLTENPKLRICMTDRTNHLADEYVKVYHCPSMTFDQCLGFCEKNCPEQSEQVLNFFTDPSKDWFLQEIGTVTPEKINGLADMIRSKPDKLPSDLREYYFNYLDRILYREEKIKCDRRIPVLKLLLSFWANTLNRPLEGKGMEDAHNFFAGKLGNNLADATEYLRLAMGLPILTVNQNGEYCFVHQYYYEYFMRKDLKIY